MKEELNRYYLIEYQDTRDTIINSNEEYKKIVENAKKNNRNEKNKVLNSLHNKFRLQKYD